MYTKGFWIILASCGQIGSKVVWGKCADNADMLMLNVMLQQYRRDNASSVTEAASEEEQHFRLNIYSAVFSTLNYKS